MLVVVLIGAAVVASTEPPTVLPLLVALGVAAGCHLMGLHQVASWPRPIEPALFGVDDEVRRAGTRMLLFSASGALLTALGTISSVCLRAWDTAAMTVRVKSEVEKACRPPPGAARIRPG